MTDRQHRGWWQGWGSPWSKAPRIVAGIAALIVLGAGSAFAQITTQDAPLRFGVEFARATPVGEFAEVTDVATGFLAWISLPISRRSALGVAAEFSVLTVPERSLAVPVTDSDAELSVALRTTLTFVGVGPRVEARLGHFSVGASLMPGFSRVIADLGGVLRDGERQQSVAVSSSEYAWAVKGGLIAVFPLYVGRRSTGVGVAGGVDYTLAGSAPFPRQDSFRYDLVRGQLLLEHPDVALSHWRVHGGVAVEF